MTEPLVQGVLEVEAPGVEEGVEMGVSLVPLGGFLRSVRCERVDTTWPPSGGWRVTVVWLERVGEQAGMRDEG